VLVLVPIADCSRVRVLRGGEPLAVHDGGWLLDTRTLDMGCVLPAACAHRTKLGITIIRYELRLLSLAVGLRVCSVSEQTR
jgi:hypothetical protein